MAYVVTTGEYNEEIADEIDELAVELRSKYSNDPSALDRQRLQRLQNPNLTVRLHCEPNNFSFRRTEARGYRKYI